ncbi:MAG: hypothetical protein E6R03_12905 [Hyphomicrobiaceae bacterium]|nr:MAG: hypothetical protein E6R03_12905 [Hyphomicrobiaceae bacterium]
MANIDACEHEWPGSGCPECRRERGDPEIVPTRTLIRGRVAKALSLPDRIGAALDRTTTGPKAGDLPLTEIFSPDLWAMIRAQAVKNIMEEMEGL